MNLKLKSLRIQKALKRRKGENIMDNRILIKGLRIEKIASIDEYDDEPYAEDHYLIFCESSNGYNKFIIELWTEYTECPSGYTSATLGYITKYPVNDFGPFSYTVINPVFLQINDQFVNYTELDQLFKYEEIKTNVFEYSSTDNDEWYPRGYTKINFDLFRKAGRAMDKKPVWILVGESGTGKSSLAWKIKLNSTGFTIYETAALKSKDELPDVIVADIIVVGNKLDISVNDDIIPRIPDDWQPIILDSKLYIK